MFKISAFLLLLAVAAYSQEDVKAQADLVSTKEEFIPKSTTEEDQKLATPVDDDSESLEGEEARYYNRYYNRQGNWQSGGWNRYGNGYYGGNRGGWNGYNNYRRRW